MKIKRITSYPDNPEHLTLVDDLNTEEMSLRNWIPDSFDIGVLTKATFELQTGTLKTIITYEPAEEIRETKESDAKAGGSG